MSLAGYSKFIPEFMPSISRLGVVTSWSSNRIVSSSFFTRAAAHSSQQALPPCIVVEASEMTRLESRLVGLRSHDGFAIIQHRQVGCAPSCFQEGRTPESRSASPTPLLGALLVVAVEKRCRPVEPRRRFDRMYQCIRRLRLPHKPVKQNHGRYFKPQSHEDSPVCVDRHPLVSARCRCERTR